VLPADTLKSQGKLFKVDFIAQHVIGDDSIGHSYVHIFHRCIGDDVTSVAVDGLYTFANHRVTLDWNGVEFGKWCTDERAFSADILGSRYLVPLDMQLRHVLRDDEVPHSEEMHLIPGQSNNNYKLDPLFRSILFDQFSCAEGRLQASIWPMECC